VGTEDLWEGVHCGVYWQRPGVGLRAKRLEAIFDLQMISAFSAQYKTLLMPPAPSKLNSFCNHQEPPWPRLGVHVPNCAYPWIRHFVILNRNVPFTSSVYIERSTETLSCRAVEG